MSREEQDVLRLQNVTFRYRLPGGKLGAPALQNIHVEIRPGECLFILGPSGAGKSSFCYTLNGLIPQFFRGRFEGEVLLGDHPVHRSPVARMAGRVGLVFQDFETQLFSTSVELEVAFGPENLGLPRDEIRRRIEEALSQVGLLGLERREPATLSGGQKQRLAIASVLSLKPTLLVLDEATTDLDPLGRQQVLSILRNLQAQGEMTLLAVEHETEEALMADRILLMAQGRIVRDAPREEILGDAELCLAHGVRPLDTALLRRRWPELPLEEGRAVRYLKERGVYLNQEALLARHREEAERYEKKLGDVLLEVRDVHHRYPGGILALEGASFTLRKGEFVAIVGQNGSGKTTLVKHFNGLLRPTQGEVLLKGRDIRQIPVEKLAGEVGYVFQNPDHQIFAETVAEEVAFGPRNLGLSEREVAIRVAEALEAVGLRGMEKADPFALTKGMRQRVAVASILAARPQIIILDEPTTGLDHREQVGMMELLKRLNEEGHTIVCITHSLWVVAAYAQRMAVVHGGRILLDLPVREGLARTEELQKAHLVPPLACRLAQALSPSPSPALTVRNAEELLDLLEEPS